MIDAGGVQLSADVSACGRPYAGRIIKSRVLHQVVHWLGRRPVIDAVAAFAMAVCVATGEFGVDFFGPTLAGFGPRLPPLWLGIPLGLTVGLLTWRRRQAPAVLLAGSLAATVLVSAQVTVMLALYTLAERTTSGPKVAASLLVSVVLVGTPIWQYAGADGAIPVTVAICVAPAFLGLYVGTRRELVERMRERAERLEREQHQRVAQARSDERTHIARDMHDVVAHRVALIVLQATALESARNGDAAARGRQIGAIGREALAELRALVGILAAMTTRRSPRSPAWLIWTRWSRIPAGSVYQSPWTWRMRQVNVYRCSSSTLPTASCRSP
jgi:hypothetical protein